VRRSTLFWGALLILFGGLLLLNNTGVIDVNVWGLIGPLFLLITGLWFVWAVIAAPESAGETEEAVIPLAEATRGRIRLGHGAGRLQIDASASSGALVSGSFAGGVQQKSRRDGDELNVELRPPSGLFMPFPPLWIPFARGGLVWNVGLSKSVPLSLDIRAGAGEIRLDLTDLQVEELNVQTGASSAEVKLPAHAGYTRVEAKGGLTSLKIEVPEGVAARIRATGGLAGISVDRSRFPRTGGVNQSPDYDSAQNKVDIHVTTGLGSLVVK